VEILRPGQPLASIGTAEGLRGCNDLLVDREGSVWIATYEQGVTQLPEPDTVLREMPGFAPATRCIARTRSLVWIGGWFGTQMLDLSSGAPGVLRAGPSTLSFPCAAG